jgi:hypothetical protein
VIRRLPSWHRCEETHSPTPVPITYIWAPGWAGGETLRNTHASETASILELRPSLFRGGPPQGVEAWLIVKGADLAVVVAKVEEADRRAAEADQVVVGVRRVAEAAVVVVAPADRGVEVVGQAAVADRRAGVDREVAVEAGAVVAVARVEAATGST